MSVFGDLRLPTPALRSLELRGVSVDHGRTRALHRANLTVGAGECIAVLGPNGAGKSTLLGVCATLTRPSEGQVVFDGRWDAQANRAAVRPHIGLVAHDALVYGDLTGPENIRFWARLYGVDPASALAWIDRVGLAHAGALPVRAYSRGMRQRLSIARALLSNPSVVLLDEPLTGLDRSGAGLLWDLLRWLREEQRTVLVVTHGFDAPPDVFTRTLVLRRGALVLDRADGDALGASYDSAVGQGR